MPRKKEDRVQKHFRVDKDTPEKLNAIAIALGYKYGDTAAVGAMLDAIAEGKILLVPVAQK